MKLKVFLSHKHRHAHQTRVFKSYLGRLAPDRFDCFASSDDIPEGDNWRDKVRQRLRESDWLIALTTKCKPEDLIWITQEITMFTELEDDPESGRHRRCIIVRGPESARDFFNHLQHFTADIEGCKQFLRHLLSTSQGCLGFNPFIGDDESELRYEAVRLWEILVDKPPPHILLPKATYRFTPEDRQRLVADEMSDSISISMNHLAAEIHGLPLNSITFTWEGNFQMLMEHMTEGQKVWIPLIAFLLDKVFREVRTQNAFILYPNKEQTRFYIPVVNKMYKFASGDREFELIYFPIETGFPKNHLCEKDRLFHLTTLCFNVQWRLLDRYMERVAECASIERSPLQGITEEFRKTRSDLTKRILIDILKIHSESNARGMRNVEKIYAMFPESKRGEIQSDFSRWMEIFGTLQGQTETLTAVDLQNMLMNLQQIVDRCLWRYSSKLYEILEVKAAMEQ